MSLAAGLAALAAVAVVARRCLSPWSAAVTTLFVALADGLVYYASELKPYSSDTLAASTSSPVP